MCKPTQCSLRRRHVPPARNRRAEHHLRNQVAPDERLLARGNQEILFGLGQRVGQAGERADQLPAGAGGPAGSRTLRSLSRSGWRPASRRNRGCGRTADWCTAPARRAERSARSSSPPAYRAGTAPAGRGSRPASWDRCRRGRSARADSACAALRCASRPVAEAKRVLSRRRSASVRGS